jgi:hypothetical protein
MEEACKRKSGEHRVEALTFKEQMGWNNSEFRTIAYALREDGDIRPNEYMTSSGAPYRRGGGSWCLELLLDNAKRT